MYYAKNRVVMFRTHCTDLRKDKMYIYRSIDSYTRKEILKNYIIIVV